MQVKYISAYKLRKEMFVADSIWEHDNELQLKVNTMQVICTKKLQWHQTDANEQTFKIWPQWHYMQKVILASSGGMMQEVYAHSQVILPQNHWKFN